MVKGTTSKHGYLEPKDSEAYVRVRVGSTKVILEDKVPKADASKRIASPSKVKRSVPPRKAKLCDVDSRYNSPPKPEVEDTDKDVVARVSRMVKVKATKPRSQTAPKERRIQKPTEKRSQTAQKGRENTETGKTGLEAYLENLEGTRAFFDEANDSASEITTESINEAKDQYQQVLSQRREVAKIYSEEDDNVQPESRGVGAGVDTNLVSLHAEDRCNDVIVTPTNKNQQEENALEPPAESVHGIFREESFSESESHPENEGIAEQVEKNETGKESALVVFIKNESKKKKKKKAVKKKSEEKKKAKEEEAKKNEEELQKKRDEYEAKLHTLFKYLKKPDDEATPTSHKDTTAKDAVAKDEIKDREAPVVSHMPPTPEIEIKSDEGGVQAVDASDISYDEDHVFAKESTDSSGKEDRNEAPTELRSVPQVERSVMAPKSSNNAVEREQAEKREALNGDCTNFCFWLMMHGHEEEETKKEESTQEQTSKAQIPEEKEGEKRDLKKEREDRAADLAKSLAMAAVMPTTTELETEDESLYGGIDVSAFRSQRARTKNSARRSIATKALKESLLNGYTTVGIDQESTPCSECGLPLLLCESELKCVVCPALESDLDEVTESLFLQDPHFQSKLALEAEIKALKEEAKDKAKAAEKAREDENALQKKKEAAAEKLGSAEEAANDAEIEILWRTKEVKKVRAVSKGASQKARSSLQAALHDKAEAKRKAKEGIIAAENACLKADHLHLGAIKEEVLAELKVFIADDEVRKAIEARDKAIAEFKGMKRCVAQLKTDYDTKQVEKAWAIAGTSMLLSRKETDIKERQAAREEAELKAVALCNSVVYEQEEAKTVVEGARKVLAEAEAEFSAEEETFRGAQEKRMALEDESEKALALANAKAKELRGAVAEFDAQISREEYQLEVAIGEKRTDATEKTNLARELELPDTDKGMKENAQESQELGDTNQVDKSEDAPAELPSEDAPAELPSEDVPAEQTDVADINMVGQVDAKNDDSLYESLATDSWNYYREICGLVSCRWKYDEAFRKVQLDPLYPYLTSLSEMNGGEKILQKAEPSYQDMTMSEVAMDLAKKAKEAKPVLLDICKELARKLKVSKIGVGPIKEVGAAVEKAEEKYDGNLLNVTDFCRAFIVVKDIATLLALFEVLSASMAPLVRRIKFSTLKYDQEALLGGYRDCKITLLVKEHLCEIQIHLSTMWSVSKLRGYAHYQKCKDYSIEKIKDPYTALNGLDKNTLTTLVSIGEQRVASTSIESLKFGDEEHIIDFFAAAGIYLQLNNATKAEAILLKLATLRSKTPGMGPLHNETLYLKKHLVAALRDQDMTEEADMIAEQLAEAERRFKDEAEDASASLWQFLYVDANEAREMSIDPNDKKGGRHDEKVEEEASAAKKQWIQSREKRFKVLKKCKVADSALALLNLRM